MAVWQTIKTQNFSYGLRMDPEFYRPEFTNLLNSLSTIKSKPISAYSKVINRGKLPEYVKDDDIGVIKSAKIQNGFIDESDEFVWSDFLHKYPEATVKYLDILVNSTGRGTLGRSAIFIKNKPHVIDGHVSKISNLQGISPFFLATYLLTHFGFKQLDAFARGSSGQTEIYPEDIGAVLVPPVSLRITERVNKLCEELYSSLEKTKNFYQEAEWELLERIEWNKVINTHVLSYTATSKDILTDERLDPEFYQPKFENLEKHLKKIGVSRLGDFCPMPNRGVQPQYKENGDVLVINSKHLRPMGIDIDGAEKTTAYFYDDEANEKAQIQRFDVLMYSTGAYIGRTNAYLNNEKAIASNHVTIIRPDVKVCDPIYLALFLNSPTGLMQTDQRASGSAQREIYPQEVVKYKVFIPRDKSGKPDLAWQKKLADKIIAANEAKKSAKQKLQEAKNLVEKEIKKMIEK